MNQGRKVVGLQKLNLCTEITDLDQLSDHLGIAIPHLWDGQIPAHYKNDLADWRELVGWSPSDALVQYLLRRSAMKTVDVLVYIHSDLRAEDRTKVTQEVKESAGVISANFDQHEHPHAFLVEYNPDAVQSGQILFAVRRHDPAATMIGL
jgi:hypothetical protein